MPVKFCEPPISAPTHGREFAAFVFNNESSLLDRRCRTADMERDLSSASAHLVLNFSDPAPPSLRGVLANATPRRFPFRLITRNLSSGM